MTSWGHGRHTSIVLEPCLMCPMSAALSNTSFELLLSAGFHQRLISRNIHIFIWNYQREMCSISQARTSNSSVLHIPSDIFDQHKCEKYIFARVSSRYVPIAQIKIGGHNQREIGMQEFFNLKENWLRAQKMTYNISICHIYHQ